MCPASAQLAAASSNISGLMQTEKSMRAGMMSFSVNSLSIHQVRSLVPLSALLVFISTATGVRLRVLVASGDGGSRPFLLDEGRAKKKTFWKSVADTCATIYYPVQAMPAGRRLRNSGAPPNRRCRVVASAGQAACGPEVMPIPFARDFGVEQVVGHFRS